MIVAVSPEGVIGLNGKIPWRHPGDLRRFKAVTMGAAVVMGRLTWESMPPSIRPLSGRRNVVITSRSATGVDGVEHFTSIESALAALGDARDVWFIGGARIYAEAMQYCDVIDVTYVPDHVTDPDAVKLPAIDPAQWVSGDLVVHEEEPLLTRRRFTRKTPRLA
jgi:dihydrofolate reductase